MIEKTHRIYDTDDFEGQSVHPYEQAETGHYLDYWQSSAEYHNQIPGEHEMAEVSLRNQRDLELLDAALDSPHELILSREIVRREDVAEEWYLKLGTFNKLQGAQKNLLTGFTHLWQGAKGVKKQGQELDVSFRKAVIEIASIKNGVISESIRAMVDQPEHASKAILAGNCLIDLVRAVPADERTKEHTVFLGLAERMNASMVDELSGKSNLEPSQKRVLSDALKFKYEAHFEGLTTKFKTGAMSEEEYQDKFNKALYRQFEEIGKYADDLSNGDLHELYFTSLLRYCVTSCIDETRYVVQAATRRQDEPHDNMGPMVLPKLSFDAKLIDLDKEIREQYIQLKMPGVTGDYVSNILVIDSLLTGRNNTSENHQELIAGINQAQSLLKELITGNQYTGNYTTVYRHIEELNSLLDLSA